MLSQKQTNQPNRKLLIGFLAALTDVVNLMISCPLRAETSGGSLYLTPATGTIGISSSINVSIKLNSGTEMINATEGTVDFDAKLIEVAGYSKAGSVLSLWTTEPTPLALANETGTFSFGGGTPRPGYKGGDGQILTISFKAKAAGNALIRFASGAVLANDGKGTNILTGMGSASFTISPQEIPPQTETEQLAATKTGTDIAVRTSSTGLPILTSATHPNPNSWYNLADISLAWELSADTDAISYKLDHEAATEPDNKPEALATEEKFDRTADGVWYFHIKAKSGDSWSETVHFRIMIDTLPPASPQAEVRQVGPGEWPEIILKSADDQSGLKQYHIIIGSLESQAHEVPASDEVFKVSGLNPGAHTAMIVALDNAGNQTVQTVDFAIEPIETPTIKDFAAEIKPNDKFFMSGSGLPNMTINLYFTDSQGAAVNDAVKTDSNGNWFYVKAGGLKEGEYAVWAEAVNDKGLKSNPTNRISFLVTPPVFAKIGSWVINYFTVFTSLIFMIMVIILAIVYIARLLRKKLKKETVEVEYVLRRNFKDLGEIIDEEFAELNKLAGTTAYNKERIKLKQRIKAYTIEAEKKIMKEIKDVEEILK